MYFEQPHVVSREQEIRKTLVKRSIISLINHNVYFSMSSSTLFGTSSTINYSDGGRTDQLIASRFMPLFGSCLEVSRQILREGLFSSDHDYTIRVINFFTVRDDNSTNPWVIPLIEFRNTENIILEDESVLDKSVSAAAVIKTDQSNSGKSKLVAGFLKAAGERVWLSVKKMTLSSDSPTHFGFREAYLYYAN